jgi:hypothetical protein
MNLRVDGEEDFDRIETPRGVAQPPERLALRARGPVRSR